jgi:hypothetical protein
MRLPASLNLLSDYGRLKAPELGEYSLENALALASGSLSITVLLQEPCNLADEVPYAKMVYGDQSAKERSSKYCGSLTLQDIDYYTECASIADHDLRDICVLDLNALLSPGVQSKSPKSKRDSDRRLAQSTTWKMIEAEPPKVLLVLTTRAGRSDIVGLRQLRCSLRSAGTMKKIHIQGHECLVIRGFHPSVYLREDYLSERGWSQADVLLAHDVLHFCFGQAFAYLQGEKVSPMDGEMLRRWKELTEPEQHLKEIPGLGSLEEAVERLAI